MTNYVNKIKNFFLKNKFFSKKDYIIISILTFIFTVLVFFRLGNIYAPNTTYITDSNNRDIVLDFGDYITIEKLHIFLGNYDSRNLSISTFNEVTGMWEIINSEAKVGSVFQWNDIDIYYNLRYLGIVSTDEEAAFNEFVITGPDNVIITPINSDTYVELFDEQDMFPSTIEKTYMDGTMFDEIYYSRTGYEFINKLPTYETTHPQLGKCLIAFSMILFGNNPFGWRFIIALFGIFFVPLMYCFSKVLFNDTFIATIISSLVTFDCMHYSLSRICTIDTIVALFIILSYYLMYRYLLADNEYRQNNKWKKDPFPPQNVYVLLLLTGIAMGLAIATKLTGVYAAVGLAIIFIYHTIKKWPEKQAFKLFWFCMLFFIAVPLIIYTLAYIPVVEKYAQMGSNDKSIFWAENGLNIGYGYTGLIAKTIRNTFYMINYHKNLVATHPFQSPAESWPIIYRTLLAANDLVKTNVSGDNYVYIRSSVNYMGNPIIWWSAIPCILYTFYITIRKKDSTACFLSIAYLAQYLPWFGVNRCIFIYHYYPSLLFSLLMIGYTIKDLLKWKPILIKYIIAYLIIAIIVFFMFFPVISGYPAPDSWGNKMEWFKTWALV